ncbi:FadR/GntR family transcriptional regulator [Streptomyces sp. NPDC091217]|uniref:FadR/GntR family transcriptional regulator n=1 Tax=Streptomyces sp. NPDC091217 TaxID=3365975 RepID=UPI00380477BC
MARERVTLGAPAVQLPNKASDEIIGSLRHEIVSGNLPVGSRLPSERDLAQHFGVSQPTVREAVRALAAMGLIEVRHGSGAYVRGDATFLVATALQVLMQMESVTILDALQVRGVLGLQSAELAATAATEEDLVALEEAWDRLEVVDTITDYDQLIHAIAGFQEALSRAGHNALVSAIELVLVRLLLQMQFKAMRPRGLKFWRKRAHSYQPDRRELLDAVRAKDPERARAAMIAYLEHQRQTFVEDPALAELRLSDPRALRAAADLSFTNVGRAARK